MVDNPHRFLWEGYDEWVINHYDASEVLIIDMDVIDVVEREEDKNKVIELVKEKLKEIRA